MNDLSANERFRALVILGRSATRYGDGTLHLRDGGPLPPDDDLQAALDTPPERPVQVTDADRLGALAELAGLPDDGDPIGALADRLTIDRATLDERARTRSRATARR